ncbi:MAG: serine/threonine protein phosphatase [Lachnospiraceae bacterium]|nr:serine/threonine protein phosphatase [Lachnospiraceae bacterium]
MSYQTRLNHAFEKAPTLPINQHTRYVFFSDCHRGIGNKNDNFLQNKACYLSALQYYYQCDFTYIEVGDGDELWENYTLMQIMETHDDIFKQLCHFHKKNRLYMLYGNHDMAKKCCENPFHNLTIYEGIIFQSRCPDYSLYVTHGHQADFLNSVLWKLARFLVRYLWTPLEGIGITDPTSASKCRTKKSKLEKKYIHYAKSFQRPLLVGHTHKETLGNEQTPYYNCGCCVHPDYITCIELYGYEIRLIQFHNSSLKREVMASEMLV